MTHEDALNFILEHACATEWTPDCSTFRIETHCSTLLIRAVMVSTMNGIKFDIIAVTEEE